MVWPAANLLEDLRMPHGMLADGKGHGLGALRGQCLEHGRRIAGPWTIVESQHDFAVAQKVWKAYA
jgi:hypothetical protein